MATLLTKKEKGFVQDFLETGNATKAALKNYDTESENVAAAIGSENLRKQKILDYLQQRAERASVRIVELSEQDENRPVALGATKDILDRAGFKPAGDEPPQVQHNTINFFTSKDVQERVHEFESDLLAKIGYARKD